MGVRHPKMFLSVGFNRAPGIFLSFGSYVGYDPALLVLTFTGFVNAHVHKNTKTLTGFVSADVHGLCLHHFTKTLGIFCLYVKTRLRGTPPEIKGNLLPSEGLVRNLRRYMAS